MNTEYFNRARAGDTLAVGSAEERQRVLNAFNQWRSRRAGTFRAKSTRTAAGYLITFLGQHPAEVLRAQNATQHSNDDI